MVKGKSDGGRTYQIYKQICKTKIVRDIKESEESGGLLFPKLMQTNLRI